jgi:hypothetical protein
MSLKYPPRMKLSPYSIDDNLVFNPGYFLMEETYPKQKYEHGMDVEGIRIP